LAMPFDFNTSTRFFVRRTNFPFTRTSTDPRAFEIRSSTRSGVARTILACGRDESSAPNSLARKRSDSLATAVVGATVAGTVVVGTVVVGATVSAGTVVTGSDGAAEAGGAAAGCVAAVVVVGEEVVGASAPDWPTDPMKRRRFGVLVPGLATTPRVADVVNSRATSAGASEGAASSRSAAAPATCGEAIEVPESVASSAGSSMPAERTPLPGARMSTHVP